MSLLDSSINQIDGSHEEDLLVTNEYEGQSSCSNPSSSGDSHQLGAATPTDRYYGVYILFYLLGMATLLPWNFFITANSYWMYKLRDLNETIQQNSTALSPLQLGFTSYLCVTSLVPSTVVLVLNAFVGHKFSFKVRIAGGLLGVILFFTATTALVEIDTDGWQMIFYSTTLASAFLINVVSSIFQGGICGLAGKFPSEYINAVISGQGLGGVFAALANIASIALGASPIESAFLYFIAADITLVISFILYFALSSTEFFLYYSTLHRSQPKLSQNSVKTQPKLSEAMRYDEPSDDDDVALIGTRFSYGQIIHQLWPYLFSVGLTYVVTLALFPSVCVLVQSLNRGQGYAWNDVYFQPVACFLLMSVADYIGRISVAKLRLPSHPRFLTCGLSLCRLVFIPLMMMCNAQPRSHLPVVIESDAGFVVVMALFAYSNGYLSNLCFTMAPKSVKIENQEVAGSLMAAALGVGLALGGALSSGIVRLL